MAVEDHPGGTQLIRIHAFLRRPVAASAIGALLGGLAVVAVLDHVTFAAGVLASFSIALLAWLLIESAAVAGSVRDAVEHAEERATPIGRARHRRPMIR
jgi:hypothetical protein